MADSHVRDDIPTFDKKPDGSREIGLSNRTALTAGGGVQSWAEAGRREG